MASCHIPSLRATYHPLKMPTGSAVRFNLVRLSSCNLHNVHGRSKEGWLEKMSQWIHVFADWVLRGWGKILRSCGKSREEGRTKGIVICSRFTKNMDFLWSGTTTLELTFSGFGKTNRKCTSQVPCVESLILWMVNPSELSGEKKDWFCIPNSRLQQLRLTVSQVLKETWHLRKMWSADWRAHQQKLKMPYLSRCESGVMTLACWLIHWLAC